MAAEKKKTTKAAGKKAMTKAEIMGELSEKTGITKKQVVEVFDALAGVVKRELAKRGPEKFVIPGLLKLYVRETKPRPAGEYKNPLTGKVENRPAKPSQRKVRATPLKPLKEMVL